MKILDCKGLECPRPVILTKKELEVMLDTELEVIVDNEVAKENISKFAKSQNYEFEVLEDQGLYRIKIKKLENKEVNENTEDNKLVIAITTDKFGVGEDALSIALMKSYLYALSESDSKLETLIFINGGIKLVVSDSDHLQTIRAIEEKGTEIISCGTCLDFYNLKDKLAIGSITNMYTIVEKMNNASKVIKI